MISWFGSLDVIKRRRLLALEWYSMTLLVATRRLRVTARLIVLGNEAKLQDRLFGSGFENAEAVNFEMS